MVYKGVYFNEDGSVNFFKVEFFLLGVNFFNKVKGGWL